MTVFIHHTTISLCLKEKMKADHVVVYNESIKISDIIKKDKSSDIRKELLPF